MAGAAIFLGGLVMLVGLSGCSPSAAVNEAEAPDVLRIAFVPQVDMEERYAAAYVALRNYLAPRLGRPVEVHQLESVTVALEALRAGRLHVCNFSPWAYLLAEDKVGLEPLLVTGAPDGGPVRYRSVLIARPQQGLSNPADILARASELTFSFEEPVSTSGHLVPRQFFHSIGLHPEKDFKQVLFSPDSTVSILAVKSGRVDLAAVSENSLERAFQKQRVRRDELVVVWSSPPILANLVAVRRNLPATFKAELQQALLEMPQADPEAWAQVTRQYSQPVVRYLAPRADMLEPLRTAIRKVPGLQIPL